MEQLSTWDYLIIAAYIVGVVVLGFYFSRRQKSLHEYFWPAEKCLGGRGLFRCTLHC